MRGITIPNNPFGRQPQRFSSASKVHAKASESTTSKIREPVVIDIDGDEEDEEEVPDDGDSDPEQEDAPQQDPHSSSPKTPRERDKGGRFLSGGVKSNPASTSSSATKRPTTSRASESQLLQDQLGRGEFIKQVQAVGPGRRSANARRESPRSHSRASSRSESRQDASGRDFSPPGKIDGVSGSFALRGPRAAESGEMRPREASPPAESARDHLGTEAIVSDLMEIDGVTEVPATVPAIEAIWRKHVKELHEHHEYHMKLILRRTRRHYERGSPLNPALPTLDFASGKSIVPEQYRHKKSPFAAMKPIQTVYEGKEKQSKDPKFQLITQTVYPFKKGPKLGKEVISTLRTPVTQYQASELCAPFYTHYTSIPSNIYADNRKKMLVEPYFKDAQEEDRSMDALFKDLKAYYDPFQNNRWSQVLRLQQRQKFLGYVEAFLKDIGCEFKDVLRYLLQDEQEVTVDMQLLGADLHAWKNRKGSLEEDFDGDHPRWKDVLEHLPPSSPKEMGRAGLAAHVFLKVSKFSIWHVAHVSEAAEFAKKLSRSQGNDETTGTFDDVACRVCHLNNCPYHGIVLQSESEEEPDDAKKPASSSQRAASDDDEKTYGLEKYCTSDEDTINYLNLAVQPRRRKLSVADEASNRNFSKPISVDTWVSNAQTNMMHKRRVFRPCDHDGSCETAECRCFKQGIQCEKTCACSSRCGRRHRGCKCAQKGKPCSKEETCDCKKLNRECDPDLCSTCGAIDVLDPVYRYTDEILRNRCHNVFIQRDRPKHTKVGISQVNGMGLYAVQNIKKGEYISEYKGEICGPGETARRGAIYSYRRNNYLFTVNTGK